ncbi:MAG: general secretion pathway protein GspK [Candidatus Rokubacteria bacterium]|nr:general secretion pathway protein GspK [Candidatus Rokubacteria bacterium]
MTGERGFALLAVMLVLALLGVVGAEFAFSMRLEASMVRTYKESVLAAHLAEAGVEQAIREVLSGAPIQALDGDGRLVFFRTAAGQPTPAAVPPLRRERVPLGPGEFSYRLTDEDSRLNINLAPPERVDRLLAALGVEKRERDIINDSLQDWKDANDEHRLNGAESEDHYLKLPVPYRARNGMLQDVSELLQIRGVTPALYRGTAERPGLGELVTVFGRNTVNVNTAPPAVLEALNLSDAEIADIVQGREHAPYPFVPGRYGGRGLGVGSRTFRIEAEGIVAGESKARVVAIVQRGTLRTGAQPQRAGAPPAPSRGVTILSWRVDPER